MKKLILTLTIATAVLTACKKDKSTQETLPSEILVQYTLTSSVPFSSGADLSRQSDYSYAYTYLLGSTAQVTNSSPTNQWVKNLTVKNAKKGDKFRLVGSQQITEGAKVQLTIMAGSTGATPVNKEIVSTKDASGIPCVSFDYSIQL